MRFLRYIIIALIGVSPVFNTLAGKIPDKFQYYTSSDGLSNNYTRCISQDMFGYIWIGTRYGLNRFDGYEFENFRKIPQDSTSLIGNAINDILPQDSLIWIATNTGFSYYDYHTEKFGQIILRGTAKENEAIKFHSFHLDKQNNIWITSDDGLFKQTDRWDEFEKYGLGEHKDKNIFRVYVQSESELWYSIQDSLFVLDPIKNNRRSFTHDPGVPQSFSGFMIYNIFEYKDDLFIATGGGGLNKYNRESAEFEHFKFKNGILDVAISPDSLFYMATWEGGLVIFDPEKKVFNNIEYQPFKKHGISSNSLNCVFFDQTKSLWIGTYGNGINKYDPHYWNFNHITYDNSGISSLSHKNVRSIMKDHKNNLWIGTEGGGLNRFNLENNQVDFFSSEHHLDQKKSNEIVLSILQDKQNNIWVGTIAGLNKVDVERKKYQSIQLIRGDLGKDFTKAQIWKMALNPNGNIWLGTNRGLIDFNPETFSYRFIKAQNKQIQEILNSGVTSILIDGNDLWLGTKKGLCKYIAVNDDFIIFQHDESNPESLSNNSINSLLKDHWGNIWVGTEYGLNKFIIPNQSFERYTKEDGLSDDRVISILGDNEGNLWISTNNGITYLNTETDSFRTYNSRDGLLMNLYNTGAYFKDRKGFLYFGGIKGVDYFNPDDIQRNTVEPDVYITDIVIKNTSESQGNPAYEKNYLFTTNQINLKHYENFFDINFEAINLTRSSKNKYKYKLEGFENDWNDAQYRKTAFYSAVPPGDYIFKVIASNNDGVWNNTGDEIMISITPPIWKTWYAILFYILIFLLLVYLGNQYTLIGVNLKNELILNKLQREKVKEIYDAKMKFFMNISHEFRTPLSLIIGPLEEALKRLPEKSQISAKLQIAYRNSNKMLNLVNQLLELRTIETGKAKLKVQRLNILELIHDAMNSFEEAAANKNIQFELKTNLNSLDIWADNYKIDRVITNLLSNAFKFTPENGRITLYVTLSKPLSLNKLEKVNGTQSLNERVKIIVEDTGSGIPENEFESIFERFYQIDNEDKNIKGTGIGLALCKELIELHDGTIEVDSELGIGSRFIIRLPLGKEYLDKEKIKNNIEDIDTVRTDNIENADSGSIISASKSLEIRNLNAFDRTAIKNPDLPDILLVDDNQDIIMFLIQSFEHTYNVQYALNVRDARKILKKDLPDIIISDVMMPEISGLEFCREVKSKSETSHIPVILLTARNTDGDTLEGIRSGADHYITKPFKVELLEEKINNILYSIRTVKSNIIKDLPIDMHKLDYESPDARFIKKLYKIVEENLSNPELEVQFLVNTLGVSRAQLYRKVESLCGQSVKEFVRTIRLKVAARLLEKGDLRISEVMYHVGINNRPYFIKRFKEMFNETPSEYMKKHQITENEGN